MGGVGWGRVGVGWGGLAGAARSFNLPRPRSGLHRGAQRLQVGRGGPWGGALVEVWQHFKPAGTAPPPVESE